MALRTVTTFNSSFYSVPPLQRKLNSYPFQREPRLDLLFELEKTASAQPAIGHCRQKHDARTTHRRVPPLKHTITSGEYTPAVSLVPDTSIQKSKIRTLDWLYTAVFCFMTPCSLVGTHRHIASKMETIRSFETLITRLHGVIIQKT